MSNATKLAHRITTHLLGRDMDQSVVLLMQAADLLGEQSARIDELEAALGMAERLLSDIDKLLKTAGK